MGRHIRPYTCHSALILKSALYVFTSSVIMKLIINPMMIGLVMPKMQPAVQTLCFTLGANAPGAAFGEDYIDLSQCASIVNRRFYRQGLHWSVGSIKIMTFGNTGAILISKLNENWVTMNAWNKGFKLWNQMNKQVLENNQSLKPKFYDFKVGMDTGHDFANNKLPIGANAALATSGEWVQSSIQLPNEPTSGTTSEFTLHMIGGDTATQKGVIRGYIQSRALISDPEPELPAGYDDNWMTQLFDTGENYEEIAQDLAVDNDETPYPQGLYPAAGSQLVGEIHDYTYITNTTVGSTTYVKGGTFPCGLIKFQRQFDNTPGDEYSYVVQIELIPGRTRGYLAQPMTQM